jgi:Zn-finger nucleic acid-binding protein
VRRRTDGTRAYAISLPAYDDHTDLSEVRSQMRSYERNRVFVDQCTGCGGLFLDRGELEALVAAGSDWHAMSAAAATPQDRSYAPQDRGYQGG